MFLKLLIIKTSISHHQLTMCLIHTSWCFLPFPFVPFEKVSLAEQLAQVNWWCCATVTHVSFAVHEYAPEKTL